MPILRNIGSLQTCAGLKSQDAGAEVRNAAIAWTSDKIKWIGSDNAIPVEFSSEEEIDAGGRLVVPGLIDCHTHLAFGGWRADEFGRRNLGESYLAIARQGGGIKSTVRATRQTSLEQLEQRCRQFLAEIQRLGVTTVECKSGYGLSTEEELKLLRTYDSLRRRQPMRIVSTFLGAHVVPEEFHNNADGYVDLIINEMLPAVNAEMLASFCDVFVEEGAFNLERSARILNAAKQLGMRPKLHADQLTDGGGALLAAEVGAISADHLEHASLEGIKAMAKAGVVAVALPFASLYLRQPSFDAREFIQTGVKVAVATDFNPGSAPSYHLPLALTLACVMNRMTPLQVLKGATLFAAHAIGLSAEIGSIEVGKQADLVMINADNVDQWLYHFKEDTIERSFVNGQELYRR